jgi:phosphatidate cytidylyltransferase
MLRTRIVTALVLLVFMGLSLFLAPPWLWNAIVFVIGLIASWEWAGLSRFPSGSRAVYVVTTAGLALALGLIAKPDPLPVLEVLFTLSVLFWSIAAPLWLKLRWRLERPSRLALAGWVVIIPTGYAMVSLRLQSPWLLLAVLAVIWISDTAAFFAGRAFGRHKLAPDISPGKTWEGVAGAMAAVTAYALWLQSGVGEGSGLLPHILQAADWRFVPLLLLLTILGIEGDLLESWVKRTAGVKDSGKILPGHGGVLDRIDALTASLPLAALLTLEVR